MSYPSASRRVANECRNVWLVTRFVSPALRTVAVSDRENVETDRRRRGALSVPRTTL